MRTHINTIGSACGRFVQYQWFVINCGKLIAQGFAETIEQAQQQAASIN